MIIEVHRAHGPQALFVAFHGSYPRVRDHEGVGIRSDLPRRAACAHRGSGPSPRAYPMPPAGLEALHGLSEHAELVAQSRWLAGFENPGGSDISSKCESEAVEGSQGQLRNESTNTLGHLTGGLDGEGYRCEVFRSCAVFKCQATRAAMTLVFPEPAPANARVTPSGAVTASRWASLRSLWLSSLDTLNSAQKALLIAHFLLLATRKVRKNAGFGDDLLSSPGSKAWGPSERASAGLRCISTVSPSAPADTGSAEHGNQRGDPAACEGSTTMGRCVHSRSKGSTVRSRVLRVAVSRYRFTLAEDDSGHPPASDTPRRKAIPELSLQGLA